MKNVSLGLNTFYCFMINTKTPVHLANYQGCLELITEKLPELSKFDRDDNKNTIILAEPHKAGNPSQHSLSLGSEGILYVMGPSVTYKTWLENLSQISKLLDQTLKWRGYSVSALSILWKYLFPVRDNPYSILAEMLRSKLCDFFDFKGLTPIDFQFKTAYTPNLNEQHNRMVLNISSNVTANEILHDSYSGDSYVVLEFQNSDTYLSPKVNIGELILEADKRSKQFADDNLSDFIASLWESIVL